VLFCFLSYIFASLGVTSRSFAPNRGGSRGQFASPYLAQGRVAPVNRRVVGEPLEDLHRRPNPQWNERADLRRRSYSAGSLSERQNAVFLEQKMMAGTQSPSAVGLPMPAGRLIAESFASRTVTPHRSRNTY